MPKRNLSYIFYSQKRFLRVLHVVFLLDEESLVLDEESLVLSKYNETYDQGNKLSGQLRKTVLSMTPQAMYNQFKRPSVGSVRELYYIYRKT